MRIVFMGTPDFAVPSLQALIGAGHDVCAVYTQPDKPQGRKQILTAPPVKTLALEHDIPVFQPNTLKNEDEQARLREIAPEVIIVVAYGKLLPKAVLDIPPHGCINVHGSLLPRWRGAAPIQWAVINGDEVSGVTTMQMDVGLDTGDILDTVEVRLDPKETGGSLFDRLSLAGGKLILSTLEKAEAGILHPVKQDEAEATHVTMLDKSMGQIDWSMDAAVIERLIRGLNPWPSAYTKFEGKTLKIWSADVEEDAAGRPSPETFGQVVRVGKDAFSVQTGKGLLTIRELQLEGKKRMDTAAFLRGYPVEAGVKLG